MEEIIGVQIQSFWTLWKTHELMILRSLNLLKSLKLLNAQNFSYVLRKIYNFL